MPKPRGLYIKQAGEFGSGPPPGSSREAPQGPRGAPMCAYKVIDYQRSIQYTLYIIKYTVYRVQYTGIQYTVYKYTGFLSIQYTSIQGKGRE